jgi:hypothetical protein
MNPVHIFPPYLSKFHSNVKSGSSSVGIATGYGLGDRCSEVGLPEEAENFSVFHRVQTGSGVHTAFCPMVTAGFFPRVKRRETENSSPSSAEVKNAWLYTSNPQYVFMAWCLVKHSENFTFSILMLFSHIRLGLPSGLFFPGFPTAILYAFLISPIRATYSSLFILLDLITLIIFGEEYNL